MLSTKWWRFCLAPKLLSIHFFISVTLLWKSSRQWFGAVRRQTITHLKQMLTMFHDFVCALGFCARAFFRHLIWLGFMTVYYRTGSFLYFCTCRERGNLQAIMNSTDLFHWLLGILGKCYHLTLVVIRLADSGEQFTQSPSKGLCHGASAQLFPPRDKW